MKIEIFKPLDNFIDNQIESLQEKPQCQNILDQFANLDDHVQKVIKITVSVIIILIPLVLMLLLSNMNSSLREEVKTKDTILNLAQKIIAQQANINNIKYQFIGKSYIENQSQMSDLLSVTIGAAGVSLSNITLNNFSVLEDSSSTPEVRFELNFSALSNKQFFDMVRILTTTTNMRFSDISLQKNSLNNLLDGTLSTHYYSEYIAQNSEDN